MARRRLAEKVPLATPIAQGATHVLMLRTVEESAAQRSSSRAEKWILDAYFTARRAAAAPEPATDEASAGVEVLQVWVPAASPAVGRLSNDGPLISGAVEVGRSAAQAQLGS